MYRQLYQMGGIGSLPMDFGQPLEVPQQMPTNFSSAQNITMNPLLNYGQPQLGQAGGTPLTMAGGGITRLGYGFGSFVSGSGVAQPVEGGSTSSGGGFGMGLMGKLIQQNPQMFRSQNTNSRYSDFIDINKNGIDDRQEAAYGGRIGYQEGGMDQMMMEPQMQEQAMMQPQMQQAPEGIMNAMPQEQGMQQQSMSQEGSQEQTALLTIVQLLIEQGIPPEQARELAMQILQAFNQGGAPAVEEFANQLEQQEGMQEPMMMANGGIMGYAQRQNYGFGSFFKGAAKAVTGAVKGVASAVKSVAKSPIGQIALAIAAPYVMSYAFGPAFATFGNATLGTFGGAALRAGISNLAIQGITTGKFNPKQALIAAIGGGVAQGVFGPAGGMTPDARDAMNLGDSLQSGQNVIGTSDTLVGNIAQPQMTSGAAFATGADVIDPTRMNLDLSGAGTNYNPMGSPLTASQKLANQAQFANNPLERGIAQAQQFAGKTGEYLSQAGTNFMNDPIATLGRGASSLYQTAKDNAVPLAIGFGASALAQQPNESDDEYSSRAARDPEVQKYITLYGGGTKLFSPEFYKATGAVDPFAGRNTFVANGGRIGYEYGSMPMGEPRRNQAGIMELDYRAKGGFVPPVGIKEKADDIPAMLSNNEFVFTANAVRNAGGGNVNKGAQKMYGLMKQLEAGGMA